jgi:hypothetical protein
MTKHVRRYIITVLVVTGVVFAHETFPVLYPCIYARADIVNDCDRHHKPADVVKKTGGILDVVSVTQVGQLTGQPSWNNTGAVNVYGTDLGSMFLHSDNRVYFLFGDTFGYPGTPGSSDWRSNTMTYTTDFTASDGITFDGWITDLSGNAKALLEGNHDPNDGSGEVTKIPTTGWSYQERQYIWFMSVKQWGAPGQWEVNHSEIAYSDDHGNEWFPSGVRWPDSSNFIQVAVAEHLDYLFVWGIPAGRFGGVKLARVSPGEVLQGAAYQYFTGTGWGGDEEDGILIVDSPVGELSVLWNPYLQRWIMMYLNENAASIEVREAHQPEGPWSEPWAVAGANDYPALYGAFMHENYMENEGQVVYFLMSQFIDYNVFLMRVEFQRNVTEVGDVPASAGKPQTCSLHQNYPNPFNCMTSITYRLSKATEVIIKIFNLLGQEVLTLVDAHQAAGDKTVVWDGRNNLGQSMDSGIYFCCLQADDTVQMRKMLLLK